LQKIPNASSELKDIFANLEKFKYLAGILTFKKGISELGTTLSVTSN
jgi:hypothetical protein